MSTSDENVDFMRISVADAVGAGERELLVAMLTRCARAIDDPKTPAAALAALMRRAQEIRKEILALDAAEAEDGDGAVDTPDEEWDEEEI